MGLEKLLATKGSMFLPSRMLICAWAGVAQWIECWPLNLRVAHSISSQGTSLGFGPGPRWGGGM